MQNISTWLWFENQAEEAVEYYAKVFKNVKTGFTLKGPSITDGKEIVISMEFSIGDAKFGALNQNTGETFTPANSFTVNCETEDEIKALWAELSGNERIMMPLETYPFSEMFGWCADKYGVSWQLNLTKTPQKITPHLMFINKNYHHAEEAINFYASIFENAKIDNIMKEDNGDVMMSHLTLADFELTINENDYDHQFNFTDATSYVVVCDTQAELDKTWDALISDGGTPGVCFWLNDKYGVTWQVVPRELDKWLGGPKGSEVADAMFTMTRPVIKDLRAIANE